jgi:hypothetical protein
MAPRNAGHRRSGVARTLNSEHISAQMHMRRTQCAVAEQHVTAAYSNDHANIVEADVGRSPDQYRKDDTTRLANMEDPAQYGSFLSTHNILHEVVAIAMYVGHMSLVWARRFFIDIFILYIRQNGFCI